MLAIIPVLVLIQCVMIRSVFVDVVGNNGIISTFRTASRKYDERRVVILLTGIRHFAREIQGFGVLAPRRTLVTARGFIKTLEYAYAFALI